MVAIMAAIAVLGVLTVGYVKGWFEQKSSETAFLTEFRGMITMERAGVAYTAKEEMVLHQGDQITCDAGATVKISIGESYITLGQNAKATITNSNTDGFALCLKEGEAFVNANESLNLEFDGKQMEFTDTVATLSVRTGTQSIAVYYGTVDRANSGQILEWIGTEKSVRTLAVTSLNEFNIAQIRKANQDKTLVFSNGDLEQLEADRLAQLQEQDTVDTTEKSDKDQKTEPDEKAEETTKTQETTNREEKPASSDKKEETTKSEENQKPDSSTKPSSKPETTTKPEEDKKPEKEEEKLTCSITIRCDTILNNWEDLETSKASYVPENGCILPNVTVEFKKGETVFDVLNRVCKKYGIQIEYSWTPMYNSYYIEGIHHLYEFDCGSESGWMYKVNGWFPNYGCSSYTLTGGEKIVWCYTCKGLGEDVGAGSW